MLAGKRLPGVPCSGGSGGLQLLLLARFLGMFAWKGTFRVAIYENLSRKDIRRVKRDLHNGNFLDRDKNSAEIFIVNLLDRNCEFTYLKWSWQHLSLSFCMINPTKLAILKRLTVFLFTYECVKRKTTLRLATRNLYKWIKGLNLLNNVKCHLCAQNVSVNLIFFCISYTITYQ